MRHIKESDWKYLGKIKDIIINRHCDAILEALELFIKNIEGAEHQTYLQIYSLVERKDKEIAITYNDLKRSNAIEKICHMRRHLAMTDEEFSKFSDEKKRYRKSHHRSLEIKDIFANKTLHTENLNLSALQHESAKYNTH